jgi:YebC/PmpR family DNA-binding regulatory protein
MSGHSHWKTVKRTKESEDKKRARIFSKLAQKISVAVKEMGKNPEANPKLRLIIEKSKEFNLPKQNIERAIKKGIGELNGIKLKSVFFEAYGPSGIAIIIKGITDNKNRLLMEIKQILNQNNGKIVNKGSVQWMFERKVDSEINSLTWVAKQTIKISEKENLACQKLFKALNKNESVQEIYHNITRN